MTAHEILTLRVELIESDPLIWRTLEIPASLPLNEVGDIIQLAMGWENCHLQAFHDRDPYARLRDDAEAVSWYDQFSLDDGLEGKAQEDTTLAQALAASDGQLVYEYDFGDSWKHRITVESSISVEGNMPRARVLDGAMRAPVEDSGGLHGWYDKVEALQAANPTPEQLDDVEWMHWRVGEGGSVDPQAFDAADVNRRIATRAVESEWNTVLGRWLLGRSSLERQYALNLAVKGDLQPAASPRELPDWFIADLVGPYRELIRMCGGEGIKLTQAGRIPPAQVSELVDRLSWEGIGYSGAGRKMETNTPAVVMLREVATQLKLVRKYRGRLVATKRGSKLAQDAQELGDAIIEEITDPGIDRVQLDSDMAHLIHWACKTSGTYGEQRQFLADFMNSLGYASGRTRLPLTEEDHVWLSDPLILWTTIIDHRSDTSKFDVDRRVEDPRQHEMARLVLETVLR